MSKMCRTIFYSLVATLVYTCGADAYTQKIFSCNSDPVENIQNLTGLDDTLKAGQTLFLIDDYVSFGDSDCTSKNILNIINRTDGKNGSDVKLKTDLGSYCEENSIHCRFKCIGTDQGLLVIDTIDRKQHYNLVFEDNYTATVLENAKNGSSVNLTKGLNVRVTNCSNSTKIIKDYTHRFDLDKASNDAGLFRWVAETNSNSLHVFGTIDYETKQEYTLIVEARLKSSSDKTLNGTATAPLIVTVKDVDDNNPKFNISESEIYQLNITENDARSVNASLKTTPPVHAYDPDFGINMTITYSILAQEKPGLFAIENDGSIKVSRQLDYEEKSVYRVLIKAAQTDKPDTATAVATLEVDVIDIDDHLPEFTKDTYTCEVNEHGIVGSVICIVTAIDNDTIPENSNFTYLLWDTDLPVSVNNLGQLTVKNSSELDRESTDGGKLTLKVGTSTMSGKVGGNATVVIYMADINDNNPVFDQDKYSFKGNASLGVVVGQVSATDNDEGGNAEITYSLLPTVAAPSCDLNLPTTPLFSVNSSTGEIAVDNIHVALCDAFILNIKACDSGINRRCNFTTVEITFSGSAEPRINTTQNITVLEGLPIGTAIDFIECRAEGHSYEKLGGSEFDIDKQTGLLKTNMVLDREANDSYSFRVDLNSSSVLLCTVDVTVTVGDVNDNAPVFSKASYQFTLTASPKVGDLIGTVGADDIDLSENGNVSYCLEDQSHSPFLLDKISGELTIKSTDLINGDIMQAFVKAIDNGTPPRQNSTVIYIVGETSHSMVPISTPLAVESINKQKTEFERKITDILNITIEIGKVDETTNKSSPYKSRIHLSTSKSSTVSRHTFLSQVLAHYEDIRSLFYQSSENTGTEKQVIGPSEIGLIVMAGVILAGAVLAIFIVHRQFSSQKRYKQLYDSLTKNSSLYESQEITVNIPDDGPDFNGTVQDQDVNQNDISNLPILSASAVNPVYRSDTDVATVADNTHSSDHDTDDPKNDSNETEVTTVLQQLTDSYDQEDNDSEKVKVPNDGDDETAPPIVYANVSGREGGSHDYVNTNVVNAQIELVPEQEGGVETDAAESKDNDLITFDSESNGDADEQMNKDGESKLPTDDMGEEPTPDYNEKQVRFHSEVLDADENKLEPLKVKTEDTGDMSSPEEHAMTNAETTDGDLADDVNNDGDTPVTEPDLDNPINKSIDEDDESPHVSIEEDTDRLEEEIESPQVPYIENIQDEFYFGDMESTHF